jgi:hypothetical protein
MEKPLYAEVVQINQNDEWESLISSGMEARSRKDESQWELGEIASRVTSKYGKEGLDKFANEVGLTRNSLYRYRDVWRGWQGKKIISAMSFSHHKIALGSEDPEKLIEMAYENNWSCERLGAEIKKPDMVEVKPDKPKQCPDCQKWILQKESTCSCN